MSHAQLQVLVIGDEVGRSCGATDKQQTILYQAYEYAQKDFLCIALPIRYSDATGTHLSTSNAI